MKQYLLVLTTLAATLMFSETSAQELAPNQNPNFAVSRDKYMQMADSVNQLHSTTVQQTYKAYDWYQNKIDRRNERIQFRRELKMERARSRYYRPYHRGGYYNNYYYRPYRSGWNSFWWF